MGGLLGLVRRAHLLPEAYVYGLADVVLGGVRPTYLLGHVYPSGRWFYFPVAFLIKTGVALLLLLPLAMLSRGLRRKHAREMLFLLMPSLIYFAIAMTSGLNIGIRHILPAQQLGTAAARRTVRGHRKDTSYCDIRWEHHCLSWTF